MLTLPYLLKKAQEGDDDAAECIKSMADAGDEDAKNALTQLAGEDGNGASPFDPIGKSLDQGDLFDLDQLDALSKSLDDVEDQEPSEVDVGEALYTDDIQAVIDVDATGFVGDLVKSILDVNTDLAAQVAYSATASDASVTATRGLCDLVKSLTAEVRAYRAEVSGLRDQAAGVTAELQARNGQGAGLQGAPTAQAMAKSFGGTGGGQPKPTGPTKGDLMKSLTAIADDSSQTMERRTKAAQLGSDLTVFDAQAVNAATQFLGASRA